MFLLSFNERCNWGWPIHLLWNQLPFDINLCHNITIHLEHNRHWALMKLGNYLFGLWQCPVLPFSITFFLFTAQPHSNGSLLTKHTTVFVTLPATSLKVCDHNVLLKGNVCSPISLASWKYNLLWLFNYNSEYDCSFKCHNSKHYFEPLLIGERLSLVSFVLKPSTP